MSEVELKKLTKSEIIGRYKDLQREFEDLQQQYNDLDDCYGELERENAKSTKETEKKQEYECVAYDFLKELRFNTELQERLFAIYKKNFIDELDALANLYCIDVQLVLQELQTEKRPKELDSEIYVILEEYIKNFERFRS